MDGPPSLVDDSSDDGSIRNATQRHRPCPNDRLPAQQRSGSEGAVNEALSSSNDDDYGESSGDESESESDDDTLIPDRAEVEEAAAFALHRLRRSQQGLEVGLVLVPPRRGGGSAFAQHVSLTNQNMIKYDQSDLFCHAISAHSRCYRIVPC